MKHTFTLLTVLLLAPLAGVFAQSPAMSGWMTPAAHAPRVEFRTFNSSAAKTKVSYHIYTPGIYDTKKEFRFPVLYWLHGSGGGLEGIPPVAAYFDAAIRAGEIPPMLVVFPNGMASSMWCDSKDGSMPMETVVIKELVPHIDATFRTFAAREGRIIEGFSMGGYGAARLGFNHPDLFAAVSIFAGGPLDLDFKGPRATGNPAERERILKSVYGNDMGYFKTQSPWVVAEQMAARVCDTTRVRLVVGDRDFTAAINRSFHDHLTKLGIVHEFMMLPGVGHDMLGLFKALGEKNVEFYHSLFAANPKTSKQ